MTRDYNKQRRDDVRPSSRNSSPGRPGDKQYPRPARPRLNRESVDRAWESGANTQHADYRTRNNNSAYGQPPRNNWRNNQPSQHSPAQGRRPYGNSQESTRGRTSYGNTGPRSRSFDADRRNFDDQRGNDRRGYSDRNAARPGFRDNHNPRPYQRRSQFGDNDQSRGYPKGASEHYDRPFRERDSDRNSRAPRNFDQQGGRRRPYNSQGPDTQNPRWRSRPAAQRDNAFRKQPHFNGQTSQSEEQFEGDYERFDAPEYRKRFSEKPSREGDAPDMSQIQPQAEDRHVTRLPDGRVLKGPRPVQRKNAQFWTEVAQQTEELVNQTEPVPSTTEEFADQGPKKAPRKIAAEGKGIQKAQSKPRTRAASAVARSRKPAGKPKSTRAAGPRPRSLKPSQRGFKWPTP